LALTDCRDHREEEESRVKARRLPQPAFVATGVCLVWAWLWAVDVRAVFAQTTGPSVSSVSVSNTSFNPSRGDGVTLSYTLSAPGEVTVSVFDAELDLVRVVADRVRQQAGPQRVVWDGRDLDGGVVPNEAYFFTIEATASGGTTVYDPVTFSGGEPFDLGRAQVSRETGTLVYQLSQPSRVLVRIGIPGSALLRTLIDWQPRVQGEITEYWNGRDQDNVINVYEQKYTVLIAYHTLPETSVITFGNVATDFRSYKSQLRGKRRAKPSRPMTNARKLSPQFMKPLSTFRDFRVSISFPELDKGNTTSVPVVRDRILVRVDVPENEREVIAGRQYEVILFADTTYFAEEERGYIPFNFPWDLKQLPAGEHVLSVNVVTFDGQIGIASRRIRIVK
jgi:hypothetical protein